MIWVTLKSGEVRRYNHATTWEFDGGRLRLGSNRPIIENTIAWIPESEVRFVEYHRPCHIERATTVSQTQLESALRIVLTEAKNVKDWSTEARLLTDLKNMLANFNMKTKRFKQVA